MNKIEETLVDIWKEIFETDAVSVTDNFFDLGATSVRIVQLFDAISKHYPDTIRIVDIFGSPTIEALSLKIMEKTGEEKLQDAKEIEF